MLHSHFHLEDALTLLHCACGHAIGHQVVPRSSVWFTHSLALLQSGKASIRVEMSGTLANRMDCNHWSTCSVSIRAKLTELWCNHCSGRAPLYVNLLGCSCKLPLLKSWSEFLVKVWRRPIMQRAMLMACSATVLGRPAKHAEWLVNAMLLHLNFGHLEV